MLTSRSPARHYFTRLVVTPCVVLALSACAVSDTNSSGTDPNSTANNPPGATDSTEHASGTITGDALWAAGNHKVDGTITFTGGTLTIAAGATVVMTSGGGTSLLFGKNAALQVQGTAAAPVLITSSSAQPAPGDWGAIDFQVGSLPSTITNANIVYGGGSQSSGAVIVEAGSTLAMSNTAVEDSGAFGVSVTGDANINGFVGNTLAHNISGPISLTANAVSGLELGTYTPNVVEGITVIVSQLSQNANWLNLGVPYNLQGLTVETQSGQAVLYVNSGIVFNMARGSSLVVQKNAGLILAGTQDAPITVTSGQSPAARGDWGDIEFFVNSLGSVNTINWTEVEFGGGSSAQSHVTTGATAQVWLEADSAAQINNSTITNSAQSGVNFEPNVTIVGFANNTIIKNSSYPVQIDVDDVRQLQPYTNTWIPNDSTGIAVSGSPMTRDATWGDLGTNYFIQDTFSVDYGLQAGVTSWTIMPGTGITFASQDSVRVTDQGQITAIGTADNYIEFAGQGAQPVDGTTWGNLEILGSGTGPLSQLEYVRFRWGGAGSMGTVWLSGDPNVTLENIDIPLIDADSAHITMYKCPAYSPHVVFGPNLTQVASQDPNYFNNPSTCN